MRASGRASKISPDPPVPGALEWLRSLLADPKLEPNIYSSRSQERTGVLAMQVWFMHHGLSAEEVARLKFPLKKPAAFLTIDDRAICFTGEFPSAETIHAFKTWQQ